jgi:hypothetical protein
VASGIGAGLSRFPSCINGAVDGNEVNKNFEVGLREACLAIIYSSAYYLMSVLKRGHTVASLCLMTKSDESVDILNPFNSFSFSSISVCRFVSLRSLVAILSDSCSLFLA